MSFTVKALYSLPNPANIMQVRSKSSHTGLFVQYYGSHPAFAVETTVIQTVNKNWLFHFCSQPYIFTV
jgi:hypothetical protein